MNLSFVVDTYYPFVSRCLSTSIQLPSFGNSKLNLSHYYVTKLVRVIRCTLLVYIPRTFKKNVESVEVLV